MGKLLFWIIVVIVALVAVRLLAIHNRNKTAADNSAAATARKKTGSKSVSGADTAPETMVRCAHCGIHMPRSEAVLSAGDTWCSTEHAKLGVRQ